jgi:hypothetical protein
MWKVQFWSQKTLKNGGNHPASNVTIDFFIWRVTYLLKNRSYMYKTDGWERSAVVTHHPLLSNEKLPKLAFYKLKHENGIKKQYKYAPAILSSFDLSFTIHSSHSQSHDTIPLKHENGIKTGKKYAPATLHSSDLSLGIHCICSQSLDTIPLNLNSSGSFRES